jgi:hypothetical protein
MENSQNSVLAGVLREFFMKDTDICVHLIAVLPDQSSERVFHEGHIYMFSSNSSLTICVLHEKLSQNSGQVRLLLDENIYLCPS